MFTVSGGSIIGAVGSPYAGMAFDYTGTTSQTINVTVTPGMASQISDIASSNSDPLNGSLQDLISNLQTQDTSLNQQVSDIDSAASTYQAQLQSQYATYQSQIQQATTTLNFLKSMLDAQSSSNN